MRIASKTELDKYREIFDNDLGVTIFQGGLIMKTYREIAKREDLPVGARYYEEMYERHGNGHTHWINLYDKDFELIEKVTFRYTDLLKSLVRVVSDARKNDMVYLNYDLSDLGNGFHLVKSNDRTFDSLQAMADSVAPEKWRAE